MAYLYKLTYQTRSQYIEPTSEELEGMGFDNMDEYVEDIADNEDIDLLYFTAGNAYASDDRQYFLVLGSELDFSDMDQLGRRVEAFGYFLRSKKIAHTGQVGLCGGMLIH